MKGLTRRTFLAALPAVPVTAAAGASVIMTVTPAKGFFAAATGEAVTIQPRAADMILTDTNMVLTPEMIADIAKESLVQLENNMVMLGNLEHFK